MTRHVSLGIALSFVLLPLIAFSDVMAEPTVSGFRLDQVTFRSSVTGVIPHSEYGLLSMDVRRDPNEPAPSRLYFLNVVGDLGSGTGWLLRNMPILGIDHLGSESMTISTLVDLTTLGIARFDGASGLSVDLQATLGLEILDLVPPFDNVTDSISIDATNIAEGGRHYLSDPNDPNDPNGVIDPDFFPSLGGPIGKSTPFDPNSIDPNSPDGCGAWRRGMEDINRDVGWDQCTPASLTNSFHWLSRTYPWAIDLSGQDYYETLAKLKEDTMWQEPRLLRVANPNDPNDLGFFSSGGCIDEEIVRGKLRFLQRPEKQIFAPEFWSVKYQGGLPPLPGTVIEGALTAHRVNPKDPNHPLGVPEFDFILDELKQGEDVEVHVSWLDANGRLGGGHSMTARGALRYGNKMYLWTSDDGMQHPPFDRDGDPVPKEMQRGNDGFGGLRHTQFHQVGVVNDPNHPNDGFLVMFPRPQGRIDLVTSESPPFGALDATVGNVNGAAGPTTDVLFVNGSSGLPFERVVELGVGDPFSLCLFAPPSLSTARYVLYLWLGAPRVPTVKILPFGLGVTGMPTPLTSSCSPQPVRIANTLGHTALLGTDRWPGPPTAPAPTCLLNIPGFPLEIDFYVQGLIVDPQSPQGQLAVTNGIRVEVESP